MFWNSRRKAHSNKEPALWPFYALAILTKWGAITGSTIGGVLAVVNGWPISTVLAVGLWAGLVVFAVGAIPAAIAAVVDAVFGFSRRRLRGAPVERTDQQLASVWITTGGLVAALLGGGYGIVYFNGFDPAASMPDVVGVGILGGAALGAAAGWVTAFAINLAERHLPGTAMTGRIKRATFVWATAVLAAGGAAYLLVRVPEQTLVPAALVAGLGAGVIPQLATTPPLDLSRIPPPSPPTSVAPPTPSPGPDSPEGGSGEGERGPNPAQRTLQGSDKKLRSNRSSIPTPMEVING